MSYSTRTTRTVRTFGGPGGTSTTTTTYSNDGGSDFDGGFGFNKRFGDMDISAGFSNGRPRFNISRNVPDEGRRYHKGWGGRSEKRRSAALPPMKLEGKTYDEIKAQCLREGRLFEDPDFLAVDSSIFYSKSPPRPFEWKRPKEICDDPQMFVEGASRFDVKQGELGDCWLLAAVASLCQNKKMLVKVVPEDQSFTDDYAGIFRFNFWQFGKWTEVIVDDRLPTYGGRLVFMHSVSSNEFWTPLVEKAYAKLVGSYEALKGGSSSEAMEDFTGGMTEMFDLRKAPGNLFQIMAKSYEKGSLMGCSIDAKPGHLEAELSNGLIMGHAYSITNVKMMEIDTGRRTGKIPMVRVRNPWGNECEWKGAWSDSSQEWKFITEEERARIGLTFDNDGEFWMSYQDFCSNFQKLEICHLSVDEMDDPTDKANDIHFESNMLDGQWIRRVNAGGCRNYLNTFWTNPQYRVHVQDTDDDDDECGTLICALMQKERRKLRKEGLDLLTVGYVIYRLEEDDNSPLTKRFFATHQSCARSDNFINLREVTSRHKLPPGHYCIVPSTFEPEQEGEFLMRIFSEKPNVAGEMDEETGMSDVQPTQELSEEDQDQDDQMREAFKKISGVDLEIDAYELKDILNAAFMKEFTFDGFSSETCRSMVAMMDTDRSGKLGFLEFKKLWNDLRLWKGVFKQFDKDSSGNFNSYEMRAAFHAIGFKVSNTTFNALVQRYSDKQGKIAFDDFVHCTVRLKHMFDVFRETDEAKEGKATFLLDEFVQTAMYS